MKLWERFFGGGEQKAKVRTVVHEVHHWHSKQDPQPQGNSFGGSPFTQPFETFEALSQSDDRTPITTAGLGPMLLMAGRWLPQPLVNYNRLLLASIAEYLYDNHGQVSYGVDSIANYSVPVIPRAAGADPAVNEVYNAYFSDWALVADYSGRFNYWELQDLACKAIDKQGDQGLLMTTDHGFPQLQTIEGWQIGALKVTVPQSMRVIDGVVLDANGTVAGYVVQTLNGPVTVPSGQMKLLYDAERFHKYRGMSAVRRGANDSRDSKDLQGFEKKAAKLKAAMAAVIEGGPIEDDPWGEPKGAGDGFADGDGTEGGEGATAHSPKEPGISIADLLGGDIPVLPAGRKLNFLANNSPGSNFGEFIEILAGFFAAGLGIPPAFLSDEKLTGPNVRAVLGKAQKKFDRRATKFADLSRWVFTRVIADGIQKKKIPARPDFDRVTFQFPSRLSIDLGDQAGNDRSDVQAGQMTRQERYGNRARDWQLETDQINRESDYIFALAEKQAKKYSVPIDIVLSSYGIGINSKVAAQPPAPEPAQQQEPGQDQGGKKQ